MRVAASGRRRALPRDRSEIAAAAAKAGLVIPDACMPGVLANLALLGRHADTLLGAPESAR